MGMTELMEKITDARKEYFDDFLPELERKREKARKREEERKAEELQRLKDDLVCFSLE